MGLSLYFFCKISCFIDPGDQFTDDCTALLARETGVIGDHFFAVVVAAFDRSDDALLVIEDCNLRIYFDGDHAGKSFFLRLDGCGCLLRKFSCLFSWSASHESAQKRK